MRRRNSYALALRSQKTSKVPSRRAKPVLLCLMLPAPNTCSLGVYARALAP